MPVPKRPAPVPNHNILDLRQVLLQRQAAEKHTRSSRPKTQKVPDRPKEPKLTKVAVPRDWVTIRREIFKFAIAAVAVLIPVTGVFAFVHISQAAQNIQHQAAGGFDRLQQGGGALGQANFTAAGQQFRQAEQELLQAQDHLSATVKVAPVVKGLPWAGKKYTTAASVLQAGVLLARAGQTISDPLAAAPPTQPGIVIKTDGLIEASFGHLQPLLRQPAAVRTAVNQLEQAIALLQGIDEQDVPAAYRWQFSLWQRISPNVNNHQLRNLSELMLGMTTGDHADEYLVVLQNNDELRATGGFPGTYLLFQMQASGLKVLDAPGNGPYALTSQIPRTALPPQPLQTIATSWNFQDSTWFLDTPTSAKFMLDFYQTARGFRPDGIIYISPSVVENLLTLTGPIHIPGYDTDISATNFLRATEEQVEIKYDKALNAPKRFLIDMIPVLVDKLSHLGGTDGWKALMTTLQQMDQKHILWYSQDASVQQAITNLGWDGAIPKTEGDYLAIVDSNLGGTKTDRVVDEKVVVNISPTDDHLQYEVRVTRSHRGQLDDFFAGKNNTEFIRLYAPASADLQSVSGNTHPRDLIFIAPDATAKPLPALQQAEGHLVVDETAGVRQTTESGKKVFGVWLRLDPGQSKTVTFTYTVPTTRKNGRVFWNLYWQKQPGTTDRNWTINVLDLNKHRLSSPVANVPVTANDQGLTFTTTSKFSHTFSVVIK